LNHRKQEAEDREQETGVRRQESGDRSQNTGYRRRESGDRKQTTDDGRWRIDEGRGISNYEVEILTTEHTDFTDLIYNKLAIKAIEKSGNIELRSWFFAARYEAPVLCLAFGK